MSVSLASFFLAERKELGAHRSVTAPLEWRQEELLLAPDAQSQEYAIRRLSWSPRWRWLPGFCLAVKTRRTERDHYRLSYRVFLPAPQVNR